MANVDRISGVDNLSLAMSSFETIRESEKGAEGLYDRLKGNTPANQLVGIVGDIAISTDSQVWMDHETSLVTGKKLLVVCYRKSILDWGGGSHYEYHVGLGMSYERKKRGASLNILETVNGEHYSRVTYYDNAHVNNYGNGDSANWIFKWGFVDNPNFQGEK